METIKEDMGYNSDNRPVWNKPISKKEITKEYIDCNAMRLIKESVEWTIKDIKDEPRKAHQCIGEVYGICRLADALKGVIGA